MADAGNYRAGQNIEDHIARLENEGLSPQEAKLKGVEEYAIECAILKVFGSEVIQYATDEAVQIYGGMGFSAESAVEAFYKTHESQEYMKAPMKLTGFFGKNDPKKAMTGEIDMMTPQSSC